MRDATTWRWRRRGTLAGAAVVMVAAFMATLALVTTTATATAAQETNNLRGAKAKGRKAGTEPTPAPVVTPPTTPPTKWGTVRAWRRDGGLKEDFPEQKFLTSKRNVGVSMSGGGSRSFTSALGYYRGLLDLQLLKDIKYISSVSGGTWATVATMFMDPRKTGVSLAEFLGEPTHPEKMTARTLREPPATRSARSFPVVQDLTWIVAEELLLLGSAPEDVWVKSIHRVFLKPAGIPFRALPAWNREQASKTLVNNPDLLNDVTFALPCGGMEPCDVPFPIINTAMLGPLEAAPFGLLQRRYVMMEVSPLSVGFPHPANVTYPNTPVVARLGGLIEPLGFGAPTPPGFCGLASCPSPPQDDDGAFLMRVPLARYPFSLANATGASSWAPGAVVAEEPLLQPLDNVLLAAPYFSPLLGGATHDLFLGDGANLENQGIITLLRRRVKRIVAFINTQVPLAPRSKYDPYLRPPYVDSDVDGSFAALFGVRGILPPIGEDFVHDQVFSRFAFARVVDALQRAQKRGKGAVASVELRTVANAWWGVPAGHKVRVLFVYLGRVYEWENRLTDDRVVRAVAPHRGLENPGVLPSNGTFRGFPHPSITQLHLQPGMANMLADLAWWVVTNNAQLFEKAVWGELGEDDHDGDEPVVDDLDAAPSSSSSAGERGEPQLEGSDEVTVTRKFGEVDVAVA